MGPLRLKYVHLDHILEPLRTITVTDSSPPSLDRCENHFSVYGPPVADSRPNLQQETSVHV